jgi:hypothetical protein
LQALDHKYTLLLLQQQQQVRHTQKKMTHTQGTLALVAAEWPPGDPLCLLHCVLCTALVAALIAARLPVQLGAQLA